MVRVCRAIDIKRKVTREGTAMVRLSSPVQSLFIYCVTVCNVVLQLSRMSWCCCWVGANGDYCAGLVSSRDCQGQCCGHDGWPLERALRHRQAHLQKAALLAPQVRAPFELPSSLMHLEIATMSASFHGCKHCDGFWVLPALDIFGSVAPLMLTMCEPVLQRGVHSGFRGIGCTLNPGP